MIRHAEAVERHYLQHPPHPIEDERPGWVLALPKTRVILRWIGSGRRVLDLGCHKGALSSAIRAAGNEVLGVDHPALADEARAACGLATLGHDLNQPLPLEDNQFDVVLASSVLDYLAGDLAFLRECWRVARPGGLLIVVVLNEVSLIRRLMALSGRMSRNFRDPDGYHTLHRYTVRGITELIEFAGFQVAEIAKCPKTYSRIPFWYWVERILPPTFATDLAVSARKPGGTSGGLQERLSA